MVQRFFNAHIHIIQAILHGLADRCVQLLRFFFFFGQLMSKVRGASYTRDFTVIDSNGEPHNRTYVMNSLAVDLAPADPGPESHNHFSGILLIF